MAEFRYAHRTESGIQRTSELSTLLESDVNQERWMFVVPHDDDVVIGGGLWLMAAIEAGVEVHVVVVTDGRMGYCTEQQHANIVQIRHDELLESFSLLGLAEQQIHCLSYPDANLAVYQGRRKANAAETVPVIAGHVGITNALTAKLREITPQRVFVPAASDLHPDHQIVHNELCICLFHASGDIWPELGKPTVVPELYEMAIYCDYPSPPTLQIRCDDVTFKRKLDAIASYRSQLQIEQLVKKVEQGGAVEYLREADFHFYDPRVYDKLFED